MVLRCLVFSLALLVTGFPAMAAAQTGAVQGHVICDDGNFPARGAKVELISLSNLLPREPSYRPPSTTRRSLQRPAVSAPRRVKIVWPLKSRTDFNGNYALASVPAGTYIVYVSEAGYSSDFPLIRKVLDRFTHEQKEKLLANFPEVTIEAGETANKNVVIYRGGAISGRVLIDSGGTAGKTIVTAVMASSDLLGDMNDGERKKPLHFALMGTTDDRGAYRIAGLPAGTYRIQVELIEKFYSQHQGNFSPSRTGTADLTVFAPNALKESDAKLVKVGEGDELSDINITVPMSRLHSISGTITQGGEPLARGFVSLAPQGQKHDEADSRSFNDDSYQEVCTVTGMVCANGGNDATTMPDGSYRFDLVPPGTYTIKAQRHPTFTESAHGHSAAPSARITIQVSDKDISDANIDIPEKGSGK